MEYAIGALLGLGVVLLARIIGADRDRALYPIVVIVGATYYDLFAVMGGSLPALVTETLIFGVFLGAAVIGFKTNLWVVVVALVGHGAFDLLHAQVISNPGVPVWWPMFCLTFDVVAGACLGWLLMHPARSGVYARRVRSGEDELPTSRP